MTITISVTANDATGATASATATADQAASTGFPNASNTGPVPGTVLTPYTGPSAIQTAGTIVENKLINGSIAILADNVTVRNCKIVYNDIFGVDIRNINATVQNCLIIGPGDQGDSPAVISTELGGAKILNCDISGGEHAIAPGSGSMVITGNYIHDGGSNKGADAHIGGISLKGDQDGILIENNTCILGSNAFGATSNIFLQNNFGPINNVQMNHNNLGGSPGYQIYVEGRLTGGPVTNISITNNVLIKGGYGYYAVTQASPTLSGNVDAVTGQPVNDPNQ